MIEKIHVISNHNKINNSYSIITIIIIVAVAAVAAVAIRHIQYHAINKHHPNHPYSNNYIKSEFAGTEDQASVASTSTDTNPITNSQKIIEGGRESLPTTASSMGDMDEEEYQLSKQIMRRNHAIHELYETERDYVTDLGRLVEASIIIFIIILVYFEVLSQQSWIPFQHKQTILRNASDLLSFHRIFLSALNPDNIDYSESDDEQLQERSFDFGEHIAQTFLKMGDHFIKYTQYCDLHDEAWELCEEYRDRSEWSQFIKECMGLLVESTIAPYSVVSGSMIDRHSSNNSQSPQQISSSSSSPVSKKLQFEDYLIKPVQRICRYQLLLKEIIRYTPDDTESFTTLTNAMNLIHETVAEIDRLKHVKDISKRTERFVQRFDGDWRINKRHVAKLGNILISGAIEVTYTALGQSVAKPRYIGCFVFPTYLILVRPKKVTTYEPKHWFPLRFAELEDLCDREGQIEHSFVVRCKKHTFAFSATCNQEKQLWLKHLDQAIDIAKNDETRDELIVPSLSGIAATRSKRSQSQQQKQRQSNVRLSRSFTNILDMKLSSSSAFGNNNVDNSRSTSGSNDNISNNNGYPMPLKLKRSISTFVQLDDIISNNIHNNNNTSRNINNYGSTESTPTKDASSTSSSPLPPATRLQKRYSADYPAARRNELLKSRTNSDITRKRPGSLDMLSSTPLVTATPNTPTNMIGKMSMQIKSNHQNALRMAVDHKLHAVCTQDYLSSRATWYLRERENSSVDLRKRKSMPFMRSSTSSFSIMSPSKRISEQQQQFQSISSHDFDIQSTISSINSTAALTAVGSVAAATTPAVIGADTITTIATSDTVESSSRLPSPRRTLPHSTTDIYSISPSCSPFVDVKSEYTHPTSTTTTTADPQPSLTSDASTSHKAHYHHNRNNSNNIFSKRRTSSPASAPSTSSTNFFSGSMERSFSSLSIQPFKKSALVDRMFNRLSNLSKKSSTNISRKYSKVSYHHHHLPRRNKPDDDEEGEYVDDYEDDDCRDSGSQYTGEDYTSDMNSYNASEVDESHQDSMSNISLRRYRSVATDQGGHHHRRRQARSSRAKGPIFRWIRSESGVSASRRSFLQDLSNNQSLNRPPAAFAYASTPAIGNQQHRHGRNSWKRKFSARKMTSSIISGS
ncbi:hypothetical protein INT45_005110, partial [Circinella minor]